MKQRILVVGGLAAGPAAAAKARRTNPGADVLLLEAGQHISYGICELPYSLSGVIPDLHTLAFFTPEQFKKEKGVQVRIQCHAEEIISGGRRLIVRDIESGRVETLAYDRLILATGSMPKRMHLQGEEARNVFRIKSFAESMALQRFLDQTKPRRAIIVGGGYVGMEMAESLVMRGIETTVAFRDPHPLPDLEPEMREAVIGELESNRVHLLPETTVSGFEVARDGAVLGLVTTGGLLETDLVIVGIGVEPNTRLAREARIRVGRHGGIVTDQRQETSIDGIYAAGDCCEVRNMVTKKLMYRPLASIAYRQGRTAGENAAGGYSVFKGALNSAAVKVFSLEVARTGLTMAEAVEAGFDPVKECIVGNSRVPVFPGNQSLKIVIIADRTTGRILGASLVGKEGAVQRANVLAAAIQHRLTVNELADLDLIYTPPFSPLVDTLHIIAYKLKKRMPGHEKPHTD